MLSKNDIINELGKGIGIYPFSPECIKENSINLCASKNAWVQKSQTIYCCDTCYDKDKRFSLTENEAYSTRIILNNGNPSHIADEQGRELPFIHALRVEQGLAGESEDKGTTTPTK